MYGQRLLWARLNESVTSTIWLPLGVLKIFSLFAKMKSLRCGFGSTVHIIEISNTIKNGYPISSNSKASVD